jgi:hypothetical protein
MSPSTIPATDACRMSVGQLGVARGLRSGQKLNSVPNRAMRGGVMTLTLPNVGPD